MYSLDINFLKDRIETQPEKSAFTNTRLPVGNMTPLYLGLAVGLALPTLVAGGWLFLQSQNSQLEQEIAAIDQELSRLGIQEQNTQKLQEQINQAQAEAQALATVFNQIRPWSAMLQDIRDRIPASVQIQTLKQTAADTPQSTPSPQASPNNNNTATPPVQSAPTPTGGIEITGIARSFNNVNDFMLTLQQSPFFKSTDTKIVTAELIDAPVPTVGGNQPSTDAAVKPPQAVQYTIQTSLSDVPASDLLRELERKGTLGLVTRIRTLQQKGVIQK